MPPAMLNHEMWQHYRHFGGAGSEPFNVPYQYRTPPPSLYRQYTNYPNFRDEVIDIDSDTAAGTIFEETDLISKKNEEEDIDAAGNAKKAENGANEGASGGPKRRPTPDLFSFFAKKKKQF